MADFNEDILNEYFGDRITEDINNKETYILDNLKDYAEYPFILNIQEYVKDISFDKVDYEKYRYKLWNTYCVNDYFFKNLQLDYIKFQTDFYINNEKQKQQTTEMINIKLLGYDLIKINDTQYDASVVGKYEPLTDIITACEEAKLDIVFYGNGQLILEKL